MFCQVRFNQPSFSGVEVKLVVKLFPVSSISKASDSRKVELLDRRSSGNSKGRRGFISDKCRKFLDKIRFIGISDSPSYERSAGEQGGGKLRF